MLWLLLLLLVVVVVVVVVYIFTQCLFATVFPLHFGAWHPSMITVHITRKSTPFNIVLYTLFDIGAS